MVQAKLWCPWTGGTVWVRSDLAHEFVAPGDVVPVRFIRMQVDGADRPVCPSKANPEIPGSTAKVAEA